MRSTVNRVVTFAATSAQLPVLFTNCQLSKRCPGVGGPVVSWAIIQSVAVDHLWLDSHAIFTAAQLVDTVSLCNRWLRRRCGWSSTQPWRTSLIPASDNPPTQCSPGPSHRPSVKQVLTLKSRSVGCCHRNATSS